MSCVTRTIIRSLLVLLVAAIATALAQDYAIDWCTIDGGGAGVSNASSSGGYTLSGTIGQPDAGDQSTPMTGGVYSLVGGFWVIPGCTGIPGDYDRDCDVDRTDFALFAACVSGPEVPYAGGCGERDFDADGDVDAGDFGIFQRCFSGANRLADPACAG